MDVTFVQDPAQFAGHAAGWLATEPLSANVLAVQLAGVLDGSRSTMPGSVWALVTGAGGAVVGVSMHTNPVGVFLPRRPPGVPTALALAFARADRVPTGASGELAAVTDFANAWERRTGLATRRSRASRLYRLGRLLPPTGVPGAARTAGAGDLDLVRDWFGRFALESAGASVDPAEHADAAHRKVAHGEVRVWTVDDRPVSMASVSAAGAAEIVLYADLADPTADGVYRRIGFVPELDAGEVTFEPATR